MPGLIDLGCRVADVYHRYHGIHGAMFGAASFRLIIDTLRSRRRHTYRDNANALSALRDELARQEPEIAGFEPDRPAKATEREVQRVLLDYLRALDKAIAALLLILENLEQDEDAYRDPGTGLSRFVRDKRHYDHDLAELERLGTQLNRLFTRF